MVSYAANGVTSSSWWHQAKQQRRRRWPTMEAFYKEFVAKEKPIRTTCTHRARRPSCSCRTRSSGQAIDKKKVRDALAKTDILTFYGPIKFSANGMNAPARPADHPGAGQDDQGAAPADIKNADMTMIKYAAAAWPAPSAGHFSTPIVLDPA